MVARLQCGNREALEPFMTRAIDRGDEPDDAAREGTWEPGCGIRWSIE